MLGLRRILCAAACSLLIAPHSARATSNVFALGGIVGLPQLEAVEFRYTGFKTVEFGMSFGTAPPLTTYLNTKVNAQLDSSLPQSAKEIPFGSSTYILHPEADFGVQSFNPFIRWYPTQGSFYVQGSFTAWRFRSSLSGNPATAAGEAFPGSISGYISYTELLFNASCGWKFDLFGSLYLDFGLGATTLRPPSVSTSLSATIGLSGGGSSGLSTAADTTDLSGVQSTLNSTATSISTQVTNAVNNLRKQFPIIPSIYLAMGLTF